MDLCWLDEAQLSPGSLPSRLEHQLLWDLVGLAGLLCYTGLATSPVVLPALSSVLWHQSLGHKFSPLSVAVNHCIIIAYYHGVFQRTPFLKLPGAGRAGKVATPCLVQRAQALSHTGGKGKNIHLDITASIYMTVESLHSYLSEANCSTPLWASVSSPAYDSIHFIGLTALIYTKHIGQSLHTEKNS